MKVFGNMNRLIVALLLAVCLAACVDKNVEKFREAMAAGNLSEAQANLTKIDDRSDCENCALQLIQAYIDANDPDKAIHVYEHITSWHKNCFDLDWKNGDYEKVVCKLLRSYLMKNGDYEKAFDYYPQRDENENDIDNAQCRYRYISDVAAAMCDKGKQDDARKFVETQLRWFMLNVDTSTSEYEVDTKTTYNSTVVREKLMEQIDNSY